MKSLRIFSVFILVVLCASILVFSSNLKVRITVSKANIRLKPTTQSDVVTTVPLGAILEASGKEGTWYSVSLPPDENGIIVTGYIHQSIVEVLEEDIEKTPVREEKVQEKEEAIQLERKEEKLPESIIETPEPESVLGEPKKFRMKSMYLTPQIGLNSWTIPFGVNVEYAVTENIGAGGTAMFWMWGSEYWSNNLISLSGEVAYHFTEVKAEKLDLYAGGGLGFSIYSWKWRTGYEIFGEGATASSGIYLIPFAGARYYFSPKIALSLRLGGAILGSWAGFAGTMGVSFSL